MIRLQERAKIIKIWKGTTTTTPTKDSSKVVPTGQYGRNDGSSVHDGSRSRRDRDQKKIGREVKLRSNATEN